MQPQPVSRRFSSQRLSLHYWEWGDAGAPVLILQHGGRDHARSWDNVAHVLCRDWRIIAPDLRGHGDSDWSPDGDYTMVSYLADFADLVAHLGAEKVTICAHSLGAMITTRYAGLYPERVAALVNIEGLGPSPERIFRREGEPFDQRLRDWIENRRRASAMRQPSGYADVDSALARMVEQNGHLAPELARHLTEHGLSQGEDGRYRWKFDSLLRVWPVLDMPQREIEALWRAVSCPMRFFHGSTSFMSNPRLDGRMSFFPQADIVEYEGAGHWLHHDCFDQFMADLKDFLQIGQ
jgi:pimeloyl-ACP methyl ester carboxylesterase